MPINRWEGDEAGTSLRTLMRDDLSCCWLYMLAPFSLCLHMAAQIPLHSSVLFPEEASVIHIGQKSRRDFMGSVCLVLTYWPLVCLINTLWYKQRGRGNMAYPGLALQSLNSSLRNSASESMLFITLPQGTRWAVLWGQIFNLRFSENSSHIVEEMSMWSNESRGIKAQSMWKKDMAWWLKNVNPGLSCIWHLTQSLRHALLCYKKLRKCYSCLGAGLSPKLLPSTWFRF